MRGILERLHIFLGLTSLDDGAALYLQEIIDDMENLLKVDKHELN